MPVYNHGPWCEQAAASVLRQTLGDLEIVAVDDGSEDDGAARLERMGCADSRLRVLSVEHGGIAAALRAGISAASGRYLARMDADDVSMPRRIEKQVAVLAAHPDVGAVDCLVDLEVSPFTGRGMVEYVEWLNSLVGSGGIAANLFVESPLVHPAVCMTREAYAASGGYLDERCPEDYSLWLRMAAAGFRLEKVPEVLLRWRDLESRLTRTDGNYSPPAIAALKARMLPRVHPRALSGVSMWGAGEAGKRMARLLAGHGVQVRRFFDIDPRKVGNRILGSPVLGVEAVAEHRGDLLLVAVGVRTAKALIRGFLAERGFVELDDYVLMA
jgi:glycosyltransferase involved in cell wall biosynthesis